MTDTELAKVITFVGELRRERVVFEGLPDEAEEYLQRTFPRLHVEPGMDYGDEGPSADAVIQGGDGARRYWTGREFLNWEPPATAMNPSNTGNAKAQLADAQAEIERLRAQLAAQQSAAPVADDSGVVPPTTEEV